jgi:hypothetical protein
MADAGGGFGGEYVSAGRFKEFQNRLVFELR